MHILLTNVHLDCRGEGSSNSNASRDESVETGDESVETGDESIEAGEKIPQSCYNPGLIMDGYVLLASTPVCVAMGRDNILMGWCQQPTPSHD